MRRTCELVVLCIVPLTACTAEVAGETDPADDPGVSSETTTAASATDFGGYIEVTNSQGRFWVRKTCLTGTNNIGPGYIYQANAFTPFGEYIKTSDTVDIYMSDSHSGGWGKFGMHFTRGMNGPFISLENSVCKGQKSGDPFYGAGASDSWMTEPLTIDPTSGEARFGIAVNLDDSVQHAIVQVIYHYRIGPSYARVWTTVIENPARAPVTTPGAWGWAKEPKFSVDDNGNQQPYDQLVMHDSDGVTVCNSIEGAGWDPRCGTAQCGDASRADAVFGYLSSDYGSVQVIAKGHSNGVPGGGTQANWYGAGMGLDNWAAVSYANPGTRPSLDANYIAQCASSATCAAAHCCSSTGGGTNRSYCSGEGRRWELIRWSANKYDASTKRCDLNTPVTPTTGALFHGWEGGSGGNDCYNNFFSFGLTTESTYSYSNYFQYKFR
jgi:hypothetical protein